MSCRRDAHTSLTGTVRGAAADSDAVDGRVACPVVESLAAQQHCPELRLPARIPMTPSVFTGLSPNLLQQNDTEDRTIIRPYLAMCAPPRARTGPARSRERGLGNLRIRGVVDPCGALQHCAHHPDGMRSPSWRTARQFDGIRQSTLSVRHRRRHSDFVASPLSRADFEKLNPERNDGRSAALRPRN